MGNIGSGVPWSLCFSFLVRGGGAARVGVGIIPGGAVSGVISSLECRRMMKYPLFPLPSYHQRYGWGVVGFVCRTICIAGVEGSTC